MMELPREDSVAASWAKCISLLFSACLPSACLILSTPKSGISSLLRYQWLIAIPIIGKRLFQEISGITTSLVINGVILGILALVLLQCCNFLAILRLDEADLVSGHLFQSTDGFFYKVSRTTGLLFNLRGIGTSWQIKRLNRFPRFYDRHSNKGKLSRSSYVVRQLFMITWQYIFLDVVNISSLDTSPEDTEKLFGHGKEFVYLNATAEQWAGRVAVGLVAWLAPARVTLDITYRCVSLLSVLLGITSAEDWPPMFGSIWEAYTIRAFWSTFWHQSCRWALTSISNFVCRDLLRLPRPSLLERYLNIAIVFLASGVVHVILDLFCWQPPSKAPTIAFFGSFAIAVMIEDGVQELYRRITGASTRNESQRSVFWHKLVGFLWVSLWLTVTSPWYLYHPARLPMEIKWIVPFSMVNFVGPAVAHTLLVIGGLVLKIAFGAEV